MINREVVIVLHSLSWDFPCDYVKQTSFELAKKASVVVFNPLDCPSFKELIFNKKKRESWLGPLKQKRDFFCFPSLDILPFKRFGVVRRVNILLNCLFFRLFYLIKFGFKKPIMWIFHYNIVEIIKWINRGKLFVYDRVDQLSSLDKKTDKLLSENEHFLFKIVDFIFVNSPRALRQIKKKNKNTYLVSCGCFIDLFSSTKIAKPKEIQDLKGPIVGFVGSFDHRISFELIYNLAKRNSSWNFVFVGGSFVDDRSQFKLVNYFMWIDKIKKLTNIHLLGKKPKEMMPDYISSFDVCLIPYDTSQEFVKGCNPMKLYEYLAMGKPVVSTPIEAVLQYEPTVKVASNATGFERAIRQFLRDTSQKNINKRKKIALDNSWENKVNKMWTIISVNI